MKDAVLDRTDVGLLQLLLQDSRATEKQMADTLNIEPGEILLRTKSMSKKGVIHSMTTRPSLNSLGARSVLVYGKCRMRSIEEAVAQIGCNDLVERIAQSTGGRFYIVLHLKKGTDLDSAIKTVERDAMMLRPTVAIIEQFDIMGPYRYSSLDWRIIHSLKDDPRKEIEKVSIELDVPYKKVKERFEKMLEYRVLDFSIDIDTNSLLNPMCYFHFESLHPDGIDSAIEELMKRHTSSILSFNAYSNMRHMMTALALVQDLEEIRSIMRSFHELKEFAYFETNPILLSVSLKTWRDKMIMKKGNAHP